MCRVARRQWKASACSCQVSFGERQTCGDNRLSGNAFAAAGKAKAFGGGGFDADALWRELQNVSDTLTHGFAVRADLGRFADECDIDMRENAAFLRDEFCGML